MGECRPVVWSVPNSIGFWCEWAATRNWAAGAVGYSVVSVQAASVAWAPRGRSGAISARPQIARPEYRAKVTYISTPLRAAFALSQLPQTNKQRAQTLQVHNVNEQRAPASSPSLQPQLGRSHGSVRLKFSDS